MASDNLLRTFKAGRSLVGAAACALVALCLVFAGTASAASVHLKKGSPSFTDNGLTLTATGTVAGVGNEDLYVNLTASAIPTATCTNPSGGNEPPGQNPATVNVTGSEAIPASEIKNGNAYFDVTTKAPATTVAGAPDCPNPNWTETITDLSFTSATITFQQGGQTVLTVTCTFSSPTSDGSVPSSQVSC